MIRHLGPTSAVVAVASLVALGLGACGSPAGPPEVGVAPEAACAGVHTEVPATAAPGATVELGLANLFAECNDTGGGPSAVLGEVQLDLRTVDTAGTVIATARADVAEDGTAVVRLTVPADAAGTLSVEHDGVSLGTVTVSG